MPSITSCASRAPESIGRSRSRRKVSTTPYPLLDLRVREHISLKSPARRAQQTGERTHIVGQLPRFEVAEQRERSRP